MCKMEENGRLGQRENTDVHVRSAVSSCSVFSLKAKETKTKTFVFIRQKDCTVAVPISHARTYYYLFFILFCRLIFSLNVEHLTRKKMTRLMQCLCYTFVSYLQCCPFCSIRFSVKLTWKVPPSVTSQFSENHFEDAPHLVKSNKWIDE